MRVTAIALLTSWALLLGAASATAQSAAESSELVLSVEAKRCVRKPATTPRELQERVSCLSYQAETGIIELLRAVAQLDLYKQREQIAWATGKVFEAEAKGRPQAARALEALIRLPVVRDPTLQRATLMALTALTHDRRERARDASKDKRAALSPPIACAERVNDSDDELASEAQACVSESNQDWPDEALVQAATAHAARHVRYGALKLLRRSPVLAEALAQRLAEYLVEQRRAGSELRDADVICEILARTTPSEARWASLSASGWSARSCHELARRGRERQSPALAPFREQVAGGRGICRTARRDGHDYLQICAFEAGGELMVRPSPVGKTRPSEQTLGVPLLAGERLESQEVRYYYLPYERPPGERWVDVVRGLVVAPVTDRYRGTRRLIVYGMHHAGAFDLLWQSPECSGEGCRLDIVQREQPATHDLTAVMLLTDERAVELDLKALLSQQLDAALGCPSLLGPLSACSALARPAPTSPR